MCNCVKGTLNYGRQLYLWQSWTQKHKTYQQYCDEGHNTCIALISLGLQYPNLQQLFKKITCKR